jgi:hypothetical protein
MSTIVPLPHGVEDWPSCALYAFHQFLYGPERARTGPRLNAADLARLFGLYEAAVARETETRRRQAVQKELAERALMYGIAG